MQKRVLIVGEGKREEAVVAMRREGYEPIEPDIPFEDLTVRARVRAYMDMLDRGVDAVCFGECVSDDFADVIDSYIYVIDPRLDITVYYYLEKTGEFAKGRYEGEDDDEEDEVVAHIDAITGDHRIALVGYGEDLNRFGSEWAYKFDVNGAGLDDWADFFMLVHDNKYGVLIVSDTDHDILLMAAASFLISNDIPMMTMDMIAELAAKDQREDDVAKIAKIYGMVDALGMICGDSCGDVVDDILHELKGLM